MPRTSNTAPVGVVVSGAGVMGSFHAESIANLKQAKLIAIVDAAEKQEVQAPASLRVADGIQRSLKSGNPVALPA
ncbi:MAG TPA: hypothetical protein VLV76_26240 [Candidatus Acidoferrum sp.]|nr:hypothetical protein [Candidatus Acidoferrum sp.]